MPIMVDREKWILYKHTNSYAMIRQVAVFMKSMASNIDDTQRHLLQRKLEAVDFYKPRNTAEMPLDSINHRINTLEYFLFGYEEKLGNTKRFIFGPLGNLFLKYLSDTEKEKKIFMSMLWGVQFPTPANKTPACFRLFPFRLLFKLMLDKRLGEKLYDTDYAYLVAFQKSCKESDYENLVSDILEWRKLSFYQQYNLMKKEEHTYVNCIYEWAYYMKGLLDNADIIRNVSGDVIGYLFHPTKANSHSSPTKRAVRTGYCQVNPQLIPFINKLMEEYSVFEEPLKLKDNPDRLEFDVIKQIYSFYPSVLLREIGEKDDLIERLLKLPRLIESYSHNENEETAYLFEDVLEDGFNMFINVEAQKIGGAGNSDIVCIYRISPSLIKKFDVEAKSTAHKLAGINAGRLRVHREAVAGKYTIVITPNYVPAVKTDIAGEPIVIILASTFSEYLYNNIYYGNREIDYKDFDDIIINNLGTDVSRLISNMTIAKFSSPTA